MVALTPYFTKVKGDGGILHFGMKEPSGWINDGINGLAMSPSGGISYSQPSEKGLGYGIKFNSGRFTTLSGHWGHTAGAGSNRFALEFWAKMTSHPSGDHYIIHRRGCYYVRLTSGTLRMSFADLYDNWGFVEFNASSHDDGVFRHYFYNYDGSTLKLYVDGVNVATKSIGGTYVNWSQVDGAVRTCIATGVDHTNNPNTYYWNGTLDSVAFYRKSLTLNAIQDHYLIGTTSVRSISTGVSSKFGWKGTLGSRTINAELLTGIGYDLGIDLNKTESSNAQPWWQHSYPYRRLTSFPTLEYELPAGHPAYLKVSKSIVDQGKANAYLSDLAMAYLSDPEKGRWTPALMTAYHLDGWIYISFQLQDDVKVGEDISGRYFLYYGDRSGIANFDLVEELDSSEWFNTYTPDSGEVSFTRPNQDWHEGRTAVAQAKATVNIFADRVRIFAKVSNNKGIAEVQINDGIWSRIDLFSTAATEEEVVVFEARDLQSGMNTIRYRCTGESRPSSLGADVNFTKIEFGNHSTFTDVMEEADDTKSWGSNTGGMVSLGIAYDNGGEQIGGY